MNYFLISFTLLPILLLVSVNMKYNSHRLSIDWNLLVKSKRSLFKRIFYFYFFYKDHRVVIERTFFSKETYTVKHPIKIFPSGDIQRGVDACVGLSG